MKRSIVLLSLVLAFLTAVTFASSACSKNNAFHASVCSDSGEQNDSSGAPEVDNWIFTADNLEDAKHIYEDFFFTTIYEDDMVVTVTNGEETLLIETIDGDKDHVVYSAEYEVYSYLDGNDYIVAVIDGKYKYYFVDEERYNESGLEFAFYLDVLSDLPDDPTVRLTSEGSSTPVGYDYRIDATLTLEIQYGNVTTNVIAVKEDDFVTSFKSVTSDEDGSYTIMITFLRGNAHITTPDVTDWFNASAPRTESDWYVVGKIGGEDRDYVPMYFDYATCCYKTDYVDIVIGDELTVKNRKDAFVSFSQSIDEDFLAGHQMIVFDPENETVFFESDEDPSAPEGAGEDDNYEFWSVVGEFDGEDKWEDDMIMGLREDGTYASDTITLHNGDKIRVRKDRSSEERYPDGKEYFTVEIDKTENYFVIFDPETKEISLEYDKMGNLDPSDIGQYLGLD